MVQVRIFVVFIFIIMNGLKVFFCFKDIMRAAARSLTHTGTAVPMVAVALLAGLEHFALVSHTRNCFSPT